MAIRFSAILLGDHPSMDTWAMGRTLAPAIQYEVLSTHDRKA